MNKPTIFYILKKFHPAADTTTDQMMAKEEKKEKEEPMEVEVKGEDEYDQTELDAMQEKADNGNECIMVKIICQENPCSRKLALSFLK